MTTTIEERLGPEYAEVLALVAGGRRLAVPMNLDPENGSRALERLLGEKLAVLVVLHFGGQTIYVPNRSSTGPNGNVDLSAVVHLTRAGRSAAFIAQNQGCSDRMVYVLRRKARALGLLPEKTHGA